MRTADVYKDVVGDSFKRRKRVENYKLLRVRTKEKKLSIMNWLTFMDCHILLLIFGFIHVWLFVSSRCFDSIAGVIIKGLCSHIEYVHDFNTKYITL